MDLKQFQLSEEVKQELRKNEWIKQELVFGKSVQEILGFSSEVMAHFYRIALSLFNQKRYEDSTNAFLFLVTLNPSQYEYWLGLGMSKQLTGHFEGAVDAFEMAALCQPDSPVPYFYLAKSFFAIHERDSALEAIDLAIDCADDYLEYEELKGRALKAKKLLLNSELGGRGDFL